MIARDEADRIEGCLASVPGARSWVLDAGSTDGTPARAQAAGATVISTDWPGFLAQRTRALGLGSAPYQLFLDADERLEPAALAEVRAVLAGADPQAQGWRFPRSTQYLGRALRHGRAWPDRQLRLIRRGAGRWEGAVHERLRVNGPVRDLAGPIAHRPYRDLAEHLRTIDQYSRLHAQLLRSSGARSGPLTPAARAGWHLVRALVLERGLLDGPQGLLFAALGAASTGLKWRRVRCG